MVVATVQPKELQEFVRTSRDLGAVAVSFRRVRGATAHAEVLAQDFARPVLDAKDSTEAMVRARALAPRFLGATLRTVTATGMDPAFWKTVAGDFRQQVERFARADGPPGVRFATSCARDAMHLFTGVGPWAEHVTFEDHEALQEFVQQAAVSDLLLFVSLVGLADGDFERRPELADLARLAWDQVVERHWATLELVQESMAESVFARFFEHTWHRGQERRDELVKRGVALTVARDAWEYWGDDLVGRYLGRAIELTVEQLPHARLTLDVAEDPETDDVRLVLRIHIAALDPTEAVATERAVMKAVASELPDCVVGSLVVDLRLGE